MMNRPSPAAFASYLGDLLDEHDDQVEVGLPRPLCVAVLSLLDYAMDEPDPLIPAPLRTAAARLAHEIAIRVNPMLDG
jgi:hypothetical protein